MAGVCQVTGAGPGFGNTISHSHRRNRRRFDVNIQKKREVVLTVSAKGIKVIDARGIESVVAQLLARGEKI